MNAPDTSQSGHLRGRRRRRVLRYLVGLFAAAGALAVVLHLPPVQRMAGRVLADFLSNDTQSQITYERFDYRLWAGEVSIHGLDLRRRGLTVTCPRAVVRLGASGVRVEIAGARVIGRLDTSITASQRTGPSRPWTALRRFATIAIERGAFELHDPNGDVWLRLEGIDGRVETAGGRPYGTAHVARADIGWPGAGLRVTGARASARFEIDPGSGALRLTEVGINTRGESRTQATGRVDQLQPLIATIDAWGRIDGRTLADVAPATQPTGTLDYRLSIRYSDAGATGTAELDTPGLTVARSGPWSGRLRSRLEGRRVVVESVDVRGYGAQISGGGVAFLGEGMSVFDLRLRAPDVATVSAALAASRPPIASQADLNFRVQIQDWKLDTLSGTGRARLNARSGPGLPISGRADVTLSRRRLTFVAPELNVRQARVEADGSYNFPSELTVNYQVHLPNLGQSRALLTDINLTAPPLALGGSVDVNGTLTGRLPNWHSNARMFTTGLTLEGTRVDVDTQVSITPQGIVVDSLVGQGPDGRFTASGFVPFGAGEWAIDAEATDVQLVELLSRRNVPLQTRIGGTLRVNGPAAYPRGRFRVDGQVAHRGVLLASGEVPGDAVVHAEGEISRRDLRIEQVRGDLAGGWVEASGTWSWIDQTFDGKLFANRIELETLPWLPLARGGVASRLSAEIFASGPVRAPAGRASFAFSGNTFRAGALPDVTLEATSDGHEASLNGRIGTRNFLNGRLPLVAPWPLHLDIDLSELPLTDVVRTLPTLRDTTALVDVDGRLTLDLPVRSPRDVRYEATVSRLEARLRRTWRAEPFVARGDEHGLNIDALTLASDGGSRLHVDGRASFDDSCPNCALAVRGEVPLSSLAVLLEDAELDGQAAWNVRLSGSLVNPDLDGTVRLAAGPGRVGRVRWSEAVAEGLLHEGTLRLGNTHVGLMGGDLLITGSIPLGARAAGGGHEIQIEARDIDLGTLLETDEQSGTDPPLPRASALVDLAARVSVPRLAIDALEGDGRVTRFAASDGSTSLDLESPVSWQLRNNAFTHSSLRLRGGRTALGIAVGLQLGDGTPRARVEIKGQVDLAAVQRTLPGGTRVEGLARLDVRVDSGPDGIVALGDTRVEAGRVFLREPPLVISDVTGTLKATGRRIELIGVHASVGDGHLSASGTIAMPSSVQPELNLDLDFERVPLTYPEGLRSRTSGKVRLIGAAGRYRLEGDAVVHRAMFSRATDRTSLSLERVNLELSAIETRGSPLQGVDLAIRVRLEDGLRIENDESELVVDGVMTLGGDLLTPEVQGSLVLREGGRIKLSRASLRIAQGRVELDGFPSRPPELNIQGRTQVTGVLIEVNVTGPPDNFSLSLSAPSRPDLTQGDLASLILTGRTASAAVSEGGAILAEQLAATLGEAVESGMGGAVFIDVSRDEDLIVQDTNPSQRLNIGVPVGRRFFVIYSQALDRNAPRWILELRPGGETRVRFISDSDESDAIEVAHRFSFNVWSRREARRTSTERTSRVGQVLIEGVSPQDGRDFRRATKLEEGTRFDYFRGEKASRDLADALRRRGYRAAIVEFSESQVAPGRVDVTFKVRPGPRLDIEWRGDDPGGDARKRAEQGWDGYLPPEESATRLAADIRRSLQADRYYTASVTASLSGTAERSRVIFDVRRGARGQRVEVRFEGNDAVSHQTLSAALPATSRDAFFSLLEPEGRTRLASAIRLACAREGFLKTATGAPRQQYDAETGVLNVVIPIDEGPRAHVVELTVPAYARAPSDAVPPDLKLSIGAPFRIGAYIEDRNRLASWYREQGYTEARVTGILEPVKTGLAVRFGVVPGPRVRVGEIRLARDGHTRPSVVRDAVTLSPGDLLRPSELERSSQRLSETGVFRSVDVRPDPAAASPTTRDIVVDLSPRDDLSVEYNIRYTTNGSGGVGDAPSSGNTDEIQFGASLEVSNPFGLAKRTRLYGLVGDERALMGVTFDSATFMGHQWRTQVFLFDDQDRLPDIPRLLGRVRGSTFQQTKRWGTDPANRWRHRVRMLWGYTFKHVRYSDPATQQTLSGDRAGLIYSLIGDTRDSVTDPHRGLFWSTGTEVALRALGSEVDYLKLFEQVYYYVPLGARVVWAQGYRVGITPGENPLLLLEGRFRAGGATSVRGFDENMLGPLTRQSEPLGGQAVLIFNQELRFPLVKRLWGGVFYDAGNAFALVRQLRLDALRQSAGAGLRFMFPFGPVRLEHAWVLDPREGEARSRWVFSLGHAF